MSTYAITDSLPAEYRRHNENSTAGSEKWDWKIEVQTQSVGSHIIPFQFGHVCSSKSTFSFYSAIYTSAPFSTSSLPS